MYSNEREDEMVEYYKKTTIIITAGPVGRSRWKPTCEVKFKKYAREMLKNLELTRVARVDSIVRLLSV